MATLLMPLFFHEYLIHIRDHSSTYCEPQLMRTHARNPLICPNDPVNISKITFSNSGINKVAMVKNALLPMSFSQKKMSNCIM